MTRKSFTRSHNYEIQLWTASDSERSSSSDVIQREQSTHKSFKTGYIFSPDSQVGLVHPALLSRSDPITEFYDVSAAAC